MVAFIRPFLYRTKKAMHVFIANPWHFCHNRRGTTVALFGSSVFLKNWRGSLTETNRRSVRLVSQYVCFGILLRPWVRQSFGRVSVSFLQYVCFWNTFKAMASLIGRRIACPAFAICLFRKYLWGHGCLLFLIQGFWNGLWWVDWIRKRMKPKKARGLGTYKSSTSNCKNKKWPIIYFFSDGFGLRSPIKSETNLAKKRYLDRSKGLPYRFSGCIFQLTQNQAWGEEWSTSIEEAMSATTEALSYTSFRLNCFLNDGAP